MQNVLCCDFRTVTNFVVSSMFRLTCMHLPFSSKWLYVGTEKGNIHVVNIENFELSGYTINWNKVIEM